MRRAIYLCILLSMLVAGALGTLYLLLFADAFRGIMFAAPGFVGMFAAYLLWDDFLKPRITGAPPRS